MFSFPSNREYFTSLRSKFNFWSTAFRLLVFAPFKNQLFYLQISTFPLFPPKKHTVFLNFYSPQNILHLLQNKKAANGSFVFTSQYFRSCSVSSRDMMITSTLWLSKSSNAWSSLLTFKFYFCVRVSIHIPMRQCFCYIGKRIIILQGDFSTSNEH